LLLLVLLLLHVIEIWSLRLLISLVNICQISVIFPCFRKSFSSHDFLDFFEFSDACLMLWKLKRHQSDWLIQHETDRFSFHDFLEWNQECFMDEWINERKLKKIVEWSWIIFIHCLLLSTRDITLCITFENMSRFQARIGQLMLSAPIKKQKRWNISGVTNANSHPLTHGDFRQRVI
jgi:hypothetical protein